MSCAQALPCLWLSASCDFSQLLKGARLRSNTRSQDGGTKMKVQVIACTSQTPRDHQLQHQYYALRAKVFGGRLGWEVSVRDGLERDEYDRLQPVYILALAETETVVGGARLLPATGPTMISHTFSYLLEAGSGFSAQGTIESSRFCVDTGMCSHVSPTGLRDVTHCLFAGIIEWSMANGFSTIATVTDVRFERILKKAGWPLQRLGPAQRVGTTMAVAGVLPADRESLVRVKPAQYRRLVAPLPHVA